MFSFFKRLRGSKGAENEAAETDAAPEAAAAPDEAAAASSTAEPAAPAARTPAPASAPAPQTVESELETVEIVPPPAPDANAKKSWLSRLKSGLSKTGSNIQSIFVNAKIDDDLYEELETALLMSDAGVDATEYLL